MATTEIFYQKVAKTLLFIYLSFFGFVFLFYSMYFQDIIEVFFISIILSPFICGGILFLLWQYCKQKGMPSKSVSLLFIVLIFFCLSFFSSFFITVADIMYIKIYNCLFASFITIAILHCMLIFSSLQYETVSRRCLLELLKIGSLSYFIFYSILYVLSNNNEFNDPNSILFIFIGEIIVVWASYLITCGKNVCITYCKLGKDNNIATAIVFYILGVCNEIIILKKVSEECFGAIAEKEKTAACILREIIRIKNNK